MGLLHKLYAQLLAPPAGQRDGAAAERDRRVCGGSSTQGLCSRPRESLLTAQGCLLRCLAVEVVPEERAAVALEGCAAP